MKPQGFKLYCTAENNTTMSLHDFMSFLKETKIASARLTAPCIVDIFSCVQVRCESVYACLRACSMDISAPNDAGQRFLPWTRSLVE
jgi:hypothetical protein